MRPSRFTHWRGLLCCALAGVMQLNASVIVQLKVVEGDETTYRTGYRATRGLTVLVTDEAGKPVPTASVSFRLPDTGASGVFSTGLRTEVVSTGADGRASVWGMQWNKTAGPVEIRITAVKDQARAGIVSTVHLNDMVVASQAGPEGVFKASHGGKMKWVVIGAVVAGGAAAGMMFMHSHSSAPTTTATPAISIGTPSIIVGHQ